MKSRINKNDWKKGYQAGLQRMPEELPPGVEVLSWVAGYAEGKNEGLMLNNLSRRKTILFHKFSSKK